MAATSMRRTLKNVVKNYTSTEVKVREATSNDPWAPSSTLMGELADLTYNSSTFSQIMQMLFKRMNDHGKNWRHVYKALILLEYLVKNGSEKVATQCKENLYSIQTLKDFTFIEDGKDHGANVRDKAKDIVALLRDDERLRNERVKAAKSRERFVQGGTGSQSQDSASGTASPNGKSEEDVSNANASAGESSAKRALAARLSGASTSRQNDDIAAVSNSSIDAASNAADYRRSLPNLGGGADDRAAVESSEELELQIALALSKQEHERELERRKQEELRLQIALEASRREVEPQSQSPSQQQATSQSQPQSTASNSRDAPTTPVRLPMPNVELRRSSNKASQRNSQVDVAAGSTQSNSKPGESSSSAVPANSDLLGLDFGMSNAVPVGSSELWPAASANASPMPSNFALSMVAFPAVVPLNGAAKTSVSSVAVPVASPKRSLVASASAAPGGSRKVSAAKALAGVQPIVYPADPWHTASSSSPAHSVTATSTASASASIPAPAATAAVAVAAAGSGETWEAFDLDAEHAAASRAPVKTDPFGDSFTGVRSRQSLNDSYNNSDGLTSEAFSSSRISAPASADSELHTSSQLDAQSSVDAFSRDSFDIMGYRADKLSSTPKKRGGNARTSAEAFSSDEKPKKNEDAFGAEDDDSEWVTVKNVASGSGNDPPVLVSSVGVNADPFEVAAVAEHDPFCVATKQSADLPPISASFSTQFDELAAIAASKSSAERNKTERTAIDLLFGNDSHSNLSTLLTTNKTNKTADRFLGENANLVNLDNLIIKSPPSQLPVDTTSLSSTNPFSNDLDDSFVVAPGFSKPTLNDLTGQSIASSSQPFAPSSLPNASSLSSSTFSDQLSNLQQAAQASRSHTPPPIAQMPTLPMVGMGMQGVPIISAQPFPGVAYAALQPRMMQPSSFGGSGMQMPAPVAIGPSGISGAAVAATPQVAGMSLGVGPIPLAGVPMYSTTMRMPIQGMSLYGMPPTIMYPQMGVAYASQPIANYGFGVALAAQPVSALPTALTNSQTTLTGSSPPTQSHSQSTVPPRT